MGGRTALTIHARAGRPIFARLHGRQAETFAQNANRFPSKPEGVTSRQETEMKATVILVAIAAANFIPMMLILSGVRSKAVEEKTRERRLAEARMNARLLRLNL